MNSHFDPATAREALNQLRTELLQFLEQSDDDAQTVSLERPIGRLSRMDQMQQQQMVLEQRRRAQRRLQQVDAALEALDRGDYGLCAECGEPIALARLKALPESRICIDCLEER
ncbi:MAG: TraR/DksA family transcriptional regulator [Candidatus Dadabacteria bacterium]|nr:MAG: TraR/DksA family transcriptional regulator [Candidatus Dadabacteria bacterium]